MNGKTTGTAAHAPMKKITEVGEEVAKAYGYRLKSFGRDERLHLAEAFMRISRNAKHSIDKKEHKFWKEIFLQLEELFADNKQIEQIQS